VVWGAPEVRQNLSNITDMLVDAPGGRHVRLGDVADVRVAASPTVIEREGVTEHVDITADVVGRSVGAVAGDVQTKLRELKFPLEFHAYLVSDYGDEQSAHLRVLTAIGAAAIGIYFLLQACFQSWRLALLFYASLLAALSGGVVATFLFGGSVLFGSLAGLLAVLGLAARNGILLIATYQRLRQAGTDADHPLLVSGARERLRAIATSTTAVAAAFLPVVFLGNVAGLEILHPMAITILGGLVTATLVTLFVVPALYLAAASQIETQVLGDKQYA
jgi:Cu/Ag efflux pump CusA